VSNEVEAVFAKLEKKAAGAVELGDSELGDSELGDGELGPLLRAEVISLGEARSRIEPAVTRADEAWLAKTDKVALRCLPIIRARLRRLPAGGDRPTTPVEKQTDRQREERAAAVADFLASPYADVAAPAGIPEFWARVFVGFSASISGEPPTRIGPVKLIKLLLWYVPMMFTLTAEQRAAAPAAITAVTRWAAERNGLSTEAVAKLDERLPTVFERFDAAYDSPRAAQIRMYLADLDGTTDGAVLVDTIMRRTTAVRLNVDDEQVDEVVDVTDPVRRRELVTQEFCECEPPPGMDPESFMAAAIRISDELWADEPVERWASARKLIDAGVSEHDVIHRLVTRDAG
jgi:hypothetical protein